MKAKKLVENFEKSAYGFWILSQFLHHFVLDTVFNFRWTLQAFLDAFPAPWKKCRLFEFLPWVFSFFLEFWVFFLSFDIFFHVFLIKLVIFHTKTSEIFQKVPTFWALGLSFEFFPWVLSFFRPWVFFRTSKKSLLKIKNLKASFSVQKSSPLNH